MKRSFTPIYVFCLLCGYQTLAQEHISDSSETPYYRMLVSEYQQRKDSLLALYPFIPAVSSILIRHGELEINHFNSLITGTRYRNDEREIKDLSGRQTFLYSTLQLTYGTSRNGRFNAGVDVNMGAVRVDWQPGATALRVFNPRELENSSYARAITSIAPRLRWRPLKKSHLITLQSSVGIPMPMNNAQQTLLGYNQYYLNTQILYNQPLGKYTFLYTQLGAQYMFGRTAVPATFFLPASIFVSYLMTDNIVVFTSISSIPIFTTKPTSLIRQNWQASGGLQFRLTRQLMINAYYANDISGRNYPDHHTYFLGFRYAGKVTGNRDQRR